MAAVGSPPAGGTTPPPTWTPPPWSPAPPPPPRRSRAPLYGAIGAVTAVVVILLALAALGVLPWFQSDAASGQPFSQARAAAQSAANGYAGGPWTLGAAIAAVPSATLSLPISSVVSNATGSSGTTSCTFSPLAEGNLTISGSQNLSGGLSNEWVFLFKNTGGTALFVSDNAGAVQLVGTISGSICATVFNALNAIPSTVVDSTTAAAAVGAAGGYAFLRAHPNANTTVEIIGGVSLFGLATIPAEWLFVYSTCPINLGGGTLTGAAGTEFTANVSITTGAVLGTATSYCGGSLIGPPPPPTLPNIGSNLVIGGLSEATAGSTHWYNASFAYASGTLPFSDLQFAVQTGAGASVTLANPTLEFEGSGGAVLASYDLANHLWLAGGAGLVQAGDRIVLSTATSLSAVGDVLVVTGTPGLASGTIAVGIP